MITGRSPFASGVLHSAWSFVGGLLPDESGKPEWSWFLIPAEEYEVVDMPIAAYGPLGFSTTILGAAQGALEEFRDWTESRLAPDGSRVAERPRIHRALAELAANIDAAELLLRRTLEVAQASTKPDSSLRPRSLRDFAHAAQLCIGAIDELMAMAGTAAFAETSVIGRAWRDIHFMAANLGISADNNYSHWGRVELGLERAPGMVIY